MTVFPAITGSAGYAALFHDGPEFDLDLVESTVLDGRTLRLAYVPHLHSGVPEVSGRNGAKRRRQRTGSALLAVKAVDPGCAKGSEVVQTPPARRIVAALLAALAHSTSAVFSHSPERVDGGAHHSE